MASSSYGKKNALISQKEFLAITQKINTLSVHDFRAISNSATKEVKQKRPPSSSNNRQVSGQELLVRIKQKHRSPSGNQLVSVSAKLITKETSASVQKQRRASDQRQLIRIRQEVVTKEVKHQVRVREVSYNYSGKEKGKSINVDKVMDQKYFHYKSKSKSTSRGI